MSKLLSYIGNQFLLFCHHLGGIAALALVSSADVLKRPSYMRIAIQDSFSLGVSCIIPVMFVTLPIGGMFALQSLILVQTFDIDRILPPVILSVIMREIGPGFAGLMISMQAGTSIAAEIAGMRSHGEIDAIDVAGIDSRGLIAGTKIIGIAMVTPILNFLAMFAALFGAFLVAVFLHNFSPISFFLGLGSGFGLAAFLQSELKALFFGFLIGAISSYFGYNSHVYAKNIGKAANQAVVACILAIFISNYLINFLAV